MSDPRTHPSPIRAARAGLLPALGSFVLVALATAGAWLAVERAIAESERVRFDSRVAATEAAIAARLDVYALAQRSAAGLFATHAPVTAAEFRAYVGSLEIRRLYPGIQGLAFSERLPGPGPERHAIKYLEPLDWRNRRAIGFDMHREPVRREAMDRARDTGAPAMSGKLKLVQETAERPQAGFIIYHPIYRGGLPVRTVAERRAALQGFIGAPFRADDLFAGIFGTDTPLLGFRIHDGDGLDPARVLHDGLGAAGEPAAADRARRLVFAGRPWTILYRPLPSFAAAADRLLPPFLLGGGLALALLLAAFAWLLASGRARAEAAVQARTADLLAANVRLAEQARALEELDRLKDNFLAILSHELRTPLNAVLGFASVLDDEVAGPLTAQQHAYMGKILRGTEVLLALIDDLLDMSRIQAGKFALEPAPLALGPLVDEVIGQLQGLAVPRGQRLLAELPADLPLLHADPQRVGQVLRNLVGNAIKFMPDAGEVRVRARTDAGTVRVEVVDSGPGIAPAQQARVFEPFTQLETGNTRSAGGTGLGLSICKALVEAHGGTIGVESAGAGRGATFWFTLPAASQDADA